MIRLFNKKKKTLAEVFHHIYYKTNWWKAIDTGSGPGSTLDNTKRIQKEIPKLLHSINAASLLDAPCGDLNWMQHVDLGNIEYTGADIIKKLIQSNKSQFPERKFLVADITTDALPTVDVVLCRDCFIHLPNDMILAAINNFKKAGIKYLLTNTYNFIQENTDIEPGKFRMINLQLPPFSFPPPDITIEEEYTSGYPDKQLGLWKF
jgi:2-polyprenyl-3-methyl-5-hydroxy-6-metoxy-1,4-benzoquinol methylase